MRGFQAGVRTSNVTSGQACLEIIAGAKPFVLQNMQVSMAAATASSFGLGRPAAKGITPTTPAAIVPNDAGPGNAQATTALAWGTSPTAPAVYMHRADLPATIGQHHDWVFPEEGILVPAGASIVVMNLASNGVCDISFDIKE